MTKVNDWKKAVYLKLMDIQRDYQSQQSIRKTLLGKSLLSSNNTQDQTDHFYIMSFYFTLFCITEDILSINWSMVLN